jgi:UPF0755 protein
MDPAHRLLEGVGRQGRETMLRLKRHSVALYWAVRSVAAAVALAALVVVALGPAARGPRPDRVVYLAPGTTTREVTALLAKERLVRHPLLFRVLARGRGLDRTLRAGEYRLSAGMSSWALLDSLSAGRVVVHRVTLPEGLQTRDVIRRLAEAGVGREQDLLALVNSPTAVFEGHLPPELVGVESLDGLLFPDTYALIRGEAPARFLRRMVERFLTEMGPLYAASPHRLEVTLRQMVILASLVEAEAQVPGERGTIAGVFYNRLTRGMPLQSCATVEFALGRHKGRLSLEDLKVDSPFNTYLHPGLPPGPIGNPGRASFAAVARPEGTPYLYFVAKGDGTHNFSRSYSDHLLAQRRYESGLRWTSSSPR